MLSQCLLQGGVETYDALFLLLIFCKRALKLVALLRKEICNLRHLMQLRHPVTISLFCMQCVIILVSVLHTFLYKLTTPCNTLQHTATNCNTLQHTATHCNTLQHTAAHCSTLQPNAHTANHCNILQHTATHCNTRQHTATHCNALQYTATRCNTLHKENMFSQLSALRNVVSKATILLNFEKSATCSTLQHTATHCNTLQHTATPCYTLQHTATHFWEVCYLQHAAAYCNTLQHTATHCNTLQHTATHFWEVCYLPMQAAALWFQLETWLISTWDMTHFNSARYEPCYINWLHCGLLDSLQHETWLFSTQREMKRTLTTPLTLQKLFFSSELPMQAAALSFQHETWLISTRDMTHFNTKHDSFQLSALQNTLWIHHWLLRSQVHTMPYLYRWFSTKEPYNNWLFCGTWPAT